MSGPGDVTTVSCSCGASDVNKLGFQFAPKRHKTSTTDKNEKSLNKGINGSTNASQFAVVWLAQKCGIFRPDQDPKTRKDLDDKQKETAQKVYDRYTKMSQTEKAAAIKIYEAQVENIARVFCAINFEDAKDQFDCYNGDKSLKDAEGWEISFSRENYYIPISVVGDVESSFCPASINPEDLRTEGKAKCAAPKPAIPTALRAEVLLGRTRKVDGKEVKGDCTPMMTEIEIKETVEGKEVAKKRQIIFVEIPLANYDSKKNKDLKPEISIIQPPEQACRLEEQLEEAKADAKEPFTIYFKDEKAKVLTVKDNKIVVPVLVGEEVQSGTYNLGIVVKLGENPVTFSVPVSYTRPAKSGPTSRPAQDCSPVKITYAGVEYTTQRGETVTIGRGKKARAGCNYSNPDPKKVCIKSGEKWQGYVAPGGIPKCYKKPAPAPDPTPGPKPCKGFKLIEATVVRDKELEGMKIERRKIESKKRCYIENGTIVWR